MDEKTIPLHSEELDVTKRQRETGTVRVKTSVHAEEVPIEAELAHERVLVNRVPVDRVVAEPVPDRWEGDTLIVSVMEEVLVVEKRLRVVEEIHLERVREVRPHRTSATIRKEEARVERVPAGQNRE